MERKHRDRDRRFTRLFIPQLAQIHTWLLPIALLAACGESPVETCPTTVDLIDPNVFAIVPVMEDPFEPSDTMTSTAPEERGRCGQDACAIEELADLTTFSIVTRECSRLTVEAPLEADLEAGDSLQLRIWHFALLPYGPAEAHLSVAIMDDVVWSRTVAIPGESELLTDAIPIEAHVAAGTPVRWHVANHGANSWNWVGLTTTRQASCPEGPDS